MGKPGNYLQMMGLPYLLDSLQGGSLVHPAEWVKL